MFRLIPFSGSEKRPETLPLAFFIQALSVAVVILLFVSYVSGLRLL